MDDREFNRVCWKLDNYLERKKMTTYKQKVLHTIKIILLTPIVYLDKVLLFILWSGMLIFMVWFMSLIVRALLKYLGE